MFALSNTESYKERGIATAGDWIYDVIFRENETEVTAVGQTSGQYGSPAWEWHGQAPSSSNPYDAFVMCTNYYEKAYTEPKATSELSERSDLKNLDINIEAREISADSNLNANGAVVFAKLKKAKLNKKRTKLTLKVENAQWKNNAEDISESSVKKYKTSKVKSSDIENFVVNDHELTINFKGNYKGSVTVNFR